MTKKIFLFVFLLLVIQIFIPIHYSFATSSPQTVKVQLFNNYPVIFRDTDGVARGLYVDLLTEIGKKENINFEYIDGTWSDGLDNIKSGKVDLLTSVGYTEERSLFMDYAKNPLLTVWGELYDLPSSDIENILEVEGKKIGIMADDINAINFRNRAEQFEISSQYIEFPNYDDVFKAVANKTVDIGIAGITFGSINKIKYGLEATGIIFNPISIYFTTAKGKNQEILLLLDRYLSEWDTQDISPMSKAKDKWLGGDVGTVKVIPSWIINSLIVFGLIIILAIGFIILLNKQVHKMVRKIKKSEELYRIVSEQSPIAIEVYDSKGLLVYANSACLKLFGIKDASEVSKFSLFDDPNIPEERKNDLKQGKSIHYEARFDFNKVKALNLYSTLNSGQILLDVIATSIKNDDEVTGYLLQIQDITERKNAEETINIKLRELEEMNKLMVGRELKMVEMKEELLKLKNKHT